MLFYFEAWDSLSSIYQRMRDDSDFEPIVVSIPRKLTGDGGYGSESLVHEFLNANDIPHIRLRETDYEAGLARLKKLEPDYIFLNYPWQRNYPPAYRPDRLVQFTRIAYVPYFLLPLVDEVAATTDAPAKQVASPVAEHLFEQRTHQLASLIFCQDDATRDAFALTERGNAYVHVTGSPKLDSLRESAAHFRAKRRKRRAKRDGLGSQDKYDLRVLWAPHHSYSPAWLNFGMFKQSYREMLNFAQDHPRVKITLRPHPFLFGTLVDRGVISKTALAIWLEAWNSLPNTKISNKAGFVKQFLRNDLLLTDGISFLAEYPLLTGKPAIFLENAHHWQFNSIGELAAKCNIRVSSVAGFEEIAQRVTANKASLPSREAEIEALRAASDPFAGHTAEVVCSLVREHFATKPRLIDPSTIKTLAWENRPGREPQAD